MIDNELSRKVSGYEHSISANGGYDTATLSINDTRDNLEEWFSDGLGRHIVVYGLGAEVIWEGFVNQITIQLGALSASRGPLMDVGNKVKVVYQTVSYATNPPVGGDRAVTAYSSDTTSQSRYGILEAVLSGSSLTATEAEQIRDTYLNEYKYPETGQELNPGNGQQPSITLECLGYYHLLEKYHYNQTASSGEVNLSDKLTAVFTADPSSRFNSDYNNVTENTLQVGQYENEDKTALAIVKDLIARGDSSDNRYIWGVYADRILRYEQAPTDISYTQRLADAEQRITTPSGNRIYPWEVLPGRWLLIPDFLVNVRTDTRFRADPKYLFIESVTYQAPWGVQLSGGKVGKLSQILSKKGLGGV